MDKDAWNKIRRAFAHVLEKQAFLFPQAMAPEDFNPGGWSYLAGTIVFQGNSWGKIRLAMPPEMAKEVGANVLGLESDDPSVEAHFVDAFREILNMTCGHVLTALHGSGAVFDLSIPRVGEITAAQLGAMAEAPESVAFRVEDYPVLLTVESGLSGEPGA